MEESNDVCYKVTADDLAMAAATGRAAGRSEFSVWLQVCV
jgi:hypothetical protein